MEHIQFLDGFYVLVRIALKLFISLSLKMLTSGVIHIQQFTLLNGIIKFGTHLKSIMFGLMEHIAV